MHTNAIQNGRAIACLNGLLGYIDVEGGMQFPQAIDVMLDDKITLWNGIDPSSPDVFTYGGEKRPLYKAFGRSNDPNTVFKAMITGEPRPVKAFIAIANDPLLCYEDANLTYKALTSPAQPGVRGFEGLLHVAFHQACRPHLPVGGLVRALHVRRRARRQHAVHLDQAVEAPGECKDDWWFFLQWGKRIKPEDWPWANEKEMVLWRFKTFYSRDMTWKSSSPSRSATPIPA